MIISKIVLGLVTFIFTCLASVAKDSTADATSELVENRMAWFREAKYGLFIHWGLYALPAGYWNGQRYPGFGEWIMEHAKIPVADYAELAEQWNPQRFDAEQWVQFAQAAGMKYIIITAKHHDGFAMYRSAVSAFNVVDATPFRRDPLKELSNACARHGMRLGVYYSQAQDWHEPGGMGNTWDFGPDEKKNLSGAYDRYLRDKAEAQVRELLTQYGALSCIWFDTPLLMTASRGQRFIELVRKLQPQCLIDGRLGANGDYVTTDDNTIPNGKGDVSGDWETPWTMNHTWGFRSDDSDWRSPTEILFKLVDVVSKGGNFLLNIGPDAQGQIPTACAANIRVVGDWLKANGEAVYGAGPSPFGDEFGEYSYARKDRDCEPVFMPLALWRCTTKPGKLYFFYFGDRRSTLDLPDFSNAIKRAYILGDEQRTPCKIETIRGRLVAYIQRQGPHATANVLCLEIDGDTVRF